MKKKLFFCLALMTMLCAFSVVAYADVFKITQPIVLNLEKNTLKYEDGTALEANLAEQVYLKNKVLYLDDANIYADFSKVDYTHVLKVEGGVKDVIILVKSDSSLNIEEREKALTTFIRMIDAQFCNLIITGPGKLTIDIENANVADQAYGAFAISSDTLSVIGKAEVYASQEYMNSSEVAPQYKQSLLEVCDSNKVPSETSLCQLMASETWHGTPSQQVSYYLNDAFNYRTISITASNNEQEGTITSLPGSTTAEQRYSLVDTGDGYIDVVRVDYSWTTPAFDIAVGGSLVWDPATLEWKGTEGAPVIVNQSDATLEFNNRSSIPVTASAVFDVVEDYEDVLPNGATFVNNNCTVDSVVNQATKEVDLTRDHVQTITASLPLDQDKLTQLVKGVRQKFGSFVVTIE